MLSAEELLQQQLEQRASDGEVDAQLRLACLLSQHGSHERAGEWLRRAAASGEACARAALGQHILVHSPQAAREGLSLLIGAAQESADAAHLVALFTAAGVGVTQSWSAALRLVQRSAELGLGLAQAELALLAGDPKLMLAALRGDAPTTTHWASIASAVDLSVWFEEPQFEIAVRSPRIGVVRQFVSAAMCDWLIERARPRVEPAQIFDKASGELRADKERTNSETHIELVDSDLILMLTRARMAAVTQIPVANFELTAFLRYTRGQFYAPHVDFFDPSLPGYAQEVATNGQRVLTFLLYLNDDYDGGETRFPLLPFSFRGSRGDALFFWNIEPNGAVDNQTLHAGLAPTRGEKWLLSQWIRAKS